MKTEHDLPAILENTAKPAWRSKTLWLNLAALLAAVLPPVREWLAANPVELVAALAAANVLVRFVTRDAVVIFPTDSDGRGGHGGGGGAGNVLPLVAALMALGCLVLTTTSCEILRASTFSVHTDEGSVGYSQDRGVEVRVDRRNTK